MPAIPGCNTNPYELILKERWAMQHVPVDGSGNASLSDRFLLPPFSVLDARQGYWQTRKRAWLSIGIQSELGRGQGAMDVSPQALLNAGGFQDHPSHRKPNATVSGAPMPAMKTKGGKTVRGDGRGRELEGGKKFGKAFNIGMNANKENNWTIEDNQGSGTSIFDPVLCELAYRWFTPVGGSILDPFAGGSVRGIVANRLRRRYFGVDLRDEQIEANRIQGALLCPDAGTNLTWVTGDSNEIVGLSSLPFLPAKYDFIFSCPPYADLEVYSLDPRDISNMPYARFLENYRRIIQQSCSLLADNRFACFIVGDMRDERGVYRGFVQDTIQAFRDAGLELYNDAVLVTSVGSLPIRVGKQFAGSRKLGKTHQNVLVFVKGDPTLAGAFCGTVDTTDFEMPAIAPEGQIIIPVEDYANVPIFHPIGEIATEDMILLVGDYTAVAAAVDIARTGLRREQEPVTRAWVGKSGKWEAIPENVLLTIIAGNRIIRNPAVFGATQSSIMATGIDATPLF